VDVVSLRLIPGPYRVHVYDPHNGSMVSEQVVNAGMVNKICVGTVGDAFIHCQPFEGCEQGVCASSRSCYLKAWGKDIEKEPR